MGRKNRYPTLVGGERFGRLTIIEEFTGVIGKEKQHIVRCQCDCGTIFETRKNSVMQGNTKSCGCLRKEISSQVNKKRHPKTYTYNGKTHTLIEWSKILGINIKTLESRKYYFRGNVEKMFDKKVKTSVNHTTSAQ